MSHPRVILKEESSVITKGTTPTSLGHQFTDAGIPFVRAQNLVDGTVSVVADPLFISNETNEALKRSKIQANDILISIAGTIGRAAIVPSDIEEMNCNQAVAIVRPSEKIDRRYLLHWLSSEDALSQMAQGKVTGVISNLSLGEIGKLRIPLPPLEEQKRIAGILDQADALRRLRRRALDRLNTLGQAIFHEMFGDPVGLESMYNRRPLKEYVQDDRPITYGILKPGPDCPEGIPYIRVVDMVIDEIDLGNIRRTTPEIASNYVRSRLQAGDLLMSIRGHVGRTSIVPEELKGANITQDTARLAVPSDEAEFFRYSILHPGTQDWMRRRTKGAAVKGINLGDLRELPVPDVPRDERITFCKKLSAIRSKLSAQRKAVTRGQALFASLQHRAFRGEL